MANTKQKAIALLCFFWAAHFPGCVVCRKPTLCSSGDSLTCTSSRGCTENQIRMNQRKPRKHCLRGWYKSSEETAQSMTSVQWDSKLVSTVVSDKHISYKTGVARWKGVVSPPQGFQLHLCMAGSYLTYYWPGDFCRSECQWPAICYVSEYWDTPSIMFG